MVHGRWLLKAGAAPEPAPGADTVEAQVVPLPLMGAAGPEKYYIVLIFYYL